MPPVGPASPSPARLWAREVASGNGPSHKAIIEVPHHRIPDMTRAPAAPNARRSRREPLLQPGNGRRHHYAFYGPAISLHDQRRLVDNKLKPAFSRKCHDAAVGRP